MATTTLQYRDYKRNSSVDIIVDLDTLKVVSADVSIGPTALKLYVFAEDGTVLRTFNLVNNQTRTIDMTSYNYAVLIQDVTRPDMMVKQVIRWLHGIGA